MKIAVIGAGAVGGYFGGRLAEAGHDVTFIVREARFKQLRKAGLVIKSPYGDVTIAEPKLALDSREIPECDLVMVAVKNYQLAGAMPNIRPLVESGARILPLLNGVEHFSLLTDEFGPEPVLGGMCLIISTLDPDGSIQHTSQLHRIVFGSLQPSQDDFCLQVRQAWEPAKLAITLSSDIWVDIWEKYAFITSFSGITTASRLSIDQVAAVEATKQIYARALREMWDLAKACGANMPDGFTEKHLNGMPKYPPGSTSSMHQDFRKGLPLEVESLQGAAIRLAGRVGVDLATIRTLYGLIKPFEKPSSFP